MLKEFVDKIVEMAGPLVSQIDGRNYSREQLEEIRDPSPQSLVVSTLGSLIDYITANRDKLSMPDLTVHVEGPASVIVSSSLSVAWRQREIYLRASREKYAQDFQFGQYLDSEEFIVQLQSRFAPSPQRAAVLKLVGNLKGEKVQTNQDDGITQSATSRTGIALVESAIVPNPVRLAPFRTFPDVEQPESDFVLRLKNGSHEGALPRAALFEADGGAWRLDAIKRVADLLRAKLPEGVSVIA